MTSYSQAVFKKSIQQWNSIAQLHYILMYRLAKNLGLFKDTNVKDEKFQGIQ